MALQYFNYYTIDTHDYTKSLRSEINNESLTKLFQNDFTDVGTHNLGLIDPDFSQWTMRLESVSRSWIFTITRDSNTILTALVSYIYDPDALFKFIDSKPESAFLAPHLIVKLNNDIALEYPELVFLESFVKCISWAIFLAKEEKRSAARDNI